MQSDQQIQEASINEVQNPSQITIIKFQPNNFATEESQTHSRVHNQYMDKEQFKDSVQNTDQKKKSDSISSVNTILTCWLCNEQQNKEDPFVNNCNCTGSTHLHVSCQVQIVFEDIKKKNDVKKQLIQKNQTYSHECSICKHKYESLLMHKYKLDCKIRRENIWMFIIGFFSLIFSILFLVLSYYAFIYEVSDDIDSTLHSVYFGLIIFFGVLCTLITTVLLFFALFMFFKAFMKRMVSTIKILSSIKTKVIECNYDNLTKSYVYNQQLLLEQAKIKKLKINHIVPNNQTTDNTPIHLIKTTKIHVINDCTPNQESPFNRDGTSQNFVSRNTLQDEKQQKETFSDIVQNINSNDDFNMVHSFS